MILVVKGRQNQINKSWKEELNKYISGIISKKGNKSIIVNGIPDHVHIFFGLNPKVAISDIARDVKNNSTNFINKSNFLKGKFYWQEGYGAFSYSQSHIKTVYKYIQDQEIHHKKKSFKEEYIGFLKRFEVEYNEKYLFEWDED